jgi:hypothetical protein
MSANQYICTVPIFQGNQGKYYIIDGYKYDIHFPLAWALDHHNHKPYYSEKKNKTYINGSGPKKCGDCSLYGSINYVFIGYCSNCLHDVYHDKRGDHSVAPGMSIGMLSEYTLWQQYPYLNGVKISEIGDKIDDKIDDEETIIDDIFVEDEYLSEANEEFEYNEDDEERMRMAHEEEFQRMCEQDDRERYDEDMYEAHLEKFKDSCCQWD